MKKLLRTQDKLLLGLAGIIDLFEMLNEPRKNAYRNMYGWDTSIFKKSHLYDSVYYGLKTGNIEKVVINGKPFIQLTNRGQEKITRKFSINKMQVKKWDGKWRIVIFDIEEKLKKSRDTLRYKLKELGFGMIQESVWISPYDVIVDFREFIKGVGLEQEVFAMEVSGILAGNIKDLVSRIWSLETINLDYKNLYEKLKNFRGREQKSINENENKKKISEEAMELRGEYLEILKDDPCLPKELLPEDWYGEKVKKLLKF